jgi:hypothetical protein
MLKYFFNVPLRLYIVFGIFIALSPITFAGHGDEQKTMNVGENSIAIDGYDTVAYFTENKATPGNDAHQYTWRDATWSFYSAKNRALFISNPVQYAPQYGAFCAMGVSMNAAVPADPLAWTIVDGKLYLNYNTEFRDKWRVEKEKNIAKADTAWAEHKHEE